MRPHIVTCPGEPAGRTPGAPSWEVAALFRLYGEAPVVTIPYHPYRSKGCTPSRPAGRRSAAGTPHTVPAAGWSGTRIMLVAIVTAPRVRRIFPWEVFRTLLVNQSLGEKFADLCLPTL